MSIFLIKDYFRIDGIDGNCVEQEFITDFVKYDSEIALECAKNQYVSFQMVFKPESGVINNVSVDFSDLAGPDTIPAENYEMFIEWFHKIGDRYLPDALIPLKDVQMNFKIPQDPKYLKEQKTGALWVDLFIPEEAAPGDYSGNIKVVADGDEKTFVINLKVYDLKVPKKSKITADLNNYADSISPAFPSLAGSSNRYADGSYFEIEKKFIRMARDHRCLFHNLGYKHSGKVVESFAPELEGEGKNIRVKSWESFDRHFGPYLDGSAFRGSRMGDHPLEFMYLPFNLGWPASYEKWGSKGYRTEYRRILQEFIRHFEEKGWKNTWFEILLNHKKDYRFFPYTADEIWYEHDEEVIDRFYDVIKDMFDTTEVKFVFRIDSSCHYGRHFDSRFSDMCKMWVVAACIYNWFPESVPVMRKKGNILWVYGWGPRRIDEPLLSTFVCPVHCFMTGATGFTLWNTTGFGKNYLETPLHNGAQAMMYPGVEFGYEGPIPTIRLKALRNHMQIMDLAMTAEGTQDESSMLRPKVEKIFNRHLGFESTAGWWMKKPDFINEPPSTWDYDVAVDEAALKPPFIGRSPVIIEKIASELYKLLSSQHDNRTTRFVIH